MYDHQLKTAPRGFPKDHEFIGLLKYKSFVFVKKADNNIIIRENRLIEDMTQAYRQLHNANIFLNEAIRENQ
jgi:uncharacterized protein (DUF2461 family)